MKNILVVLVLASVCVRAHAGEVIRIEGAQLPIIESVAGFYPPTADETDDSLPYPEKRLLIANKLLDDLSLLSAIVTVGSDGDLWPAVVCNVERCPGECVFQAQVKAQGAVKAVKVRLFQDGADIMAQTIWARYDLLGGLFGIGGNMDVTFSGESSIQTCNKEPANNQYGLYSVALAESYDLGAVATVVGERGISSDDIVQVGDRVVAKIDETATSVDPLAGARTVLGPHAQLLVTNRVTTTLGSTFVGTNNVVSIRAVSGAAVDECSTGGDKLLTENVASLVIAEGSTLDDVVEIVSCDFRWDVTSKPKPATTAEPADKRANDATWLTCIDRKESGIVFQTQWINTSGDTIFCSVNEIFEDGGALKVRRLKGLYGNRNQHPLGTDFLTASGVNNNGGNNMISNLVVKVRRAPALSVVGNMSALLGAQVDISGKIFCSADDENALPKTGTLKIANGATVQVNKNVSVDGLLTVVGPGGTFAQGVNAAGDSKDQGVNFQQYFSSGNRMSVAGGTLAFATVKSYYGGTSDAGCYVNSLALSDGGRVTGFLPRIDASTKDARWTISGSGTSTAVGALMVQLNYNYYGCGFYLDVAECTDDEEADFVTTGNLTEYNRHYDSPFYGCRVIKTGAGTWRMDGKSQYYGFTEVEGGTLLVNGTGLIGSSAGLVLGNGSFAVSSGTTNVMKTLTVKAGTSGIFIGDNAELSFPDPSADVALYTNAGQTPVVRKGMIIEDEAERVKVTLGENSRIFIGSSACLTASQLRKFRINDMRVRQESDGSLVPYVSGLTIILR